MCERLKFHQLFYFCYFGHTMHSTMSRDSSFIRVADSWLETFVSVLRTVRSIVTKLTLFAVFELSKNQTGHGRVTLCQEENFVEQKRKEYYCTHYMIICLLFCDVNINSTRQPHNTHAEFTRQYGGICFLLFFLYYGHKSFAKLIVFENIYLHWDSNEINIHIFQDNVYSLKENNTS